MFTTRALIGPGQTCRIFGQPEKAMETCKLGFSDGCDNLYLLKIEGKETDLELPQAIGAFTVYVQAWKEFTTNESLAFTVYNPTNETIEFQAFVKNL